MNRFPDQLDQVPEDQHLKEAVGLGFGGVAAGCALIFLAYSLQLVHAYKQDDALIAAGVLVVGAICGYLEIRRRRLPLTLVTRGEEIGAYRAGRFVQAFHRGQTTWYQLSWVNTFREVMMFGFMALSLSLAMLGFLASLKFNVIVAWMVGGAIAADLLFYSSILTRVMSKQYYLPNTSFGAIRNGLPPQTVNNQPTQSLFTRLNAAKVEWRSYVSDVASPAVFVGLLSSNDQNFKPLDQFFADAEAGSLPAVSVVEAYFTGDVRADQSDEHPAANIQRGQQFTKRVVDAVMHSPQWPRTAMVLLYDEHGGFYDSQRPPAACEPDDLRPVGDEARRFDHLGFRTPLMVISPYAKRNYVSHVPVDHTAVTRLVETRFDLPALTRRDANAWPLLDMFDFDHPDFSVPELPEAIIDPARDEQCKRDFP